MRTNEELAAALGVNIRTLERNRRAGLPLPADGEDLAGWATRAKRWKREHRKKPGPRSDLSTGDLDARAAAEIRFRLARAEKAELEVAVLKGELHSKHECESAAAARLQDLVTVLAQLGDTCGRKLYQAPSPEAIKMFVDDEVRRCLEVLFDDRMDSTPASGAAPAGEALGQ